MKRVTPAKSSAQVGRVTNYLSDFLGLVSLVALMLSLIGIFYLFRSYLDAKKYTFAILRSLGLTIKEVFIMQIISLLILSSLSILMSFLLTSITLPILNGYISNIFEMDIHLSLTIATISFTLLVGYLSPLLVGIPLLISYLKQKTLNLFQEGRDIFSGFSFKHIFKFAPLIFFFTLLSSWLSQSIKTSLIFIGILIFIFSILFPLFYWILGLLERHLKLNKLELNLSLRYMARYRIASISIFLALLFSCLLITLIPALENNLNTELNMASKDKTPSLFLFDIQEEQVNGLKKFSKEKNVELLGLSPMVRGRLVKINGEDFKVDTSEALTREEESSQRLRNRGINITYKEILGDNEKIIEGDELGAVREGELPDISLEYRYAQRMGISLGDKMTFEISGIEQEGIVRNFRKVRWTSFMPSFFINFPPGVFEDAPKTFLAAVPNLEVREKSEYQFKLTELFPNISSLELDALISKIKSVIEQISLTITVMSLLVVLVGMIVVFSLINHQLNERRKDIFLLKILGLKYPQLRLILLNEFFILAVSASILGLFLGIFISYGFSYFLFEGIWFFDITYLILILSSFVILVMLITWLTSFKILKEKPILFL